MPRVRRRAYGRHGRRNRARDQAFAMRYPPRLPLLLGCFEGVEALGEAALLAGGGVFVDDAVGRSAIKKDTGRAELLNGFIAAAGGQSVDEPTNLALEGALAALVAFGAAGVLADALEG